MPVKGYRINDFAYITDANFISDIEKQKLNKRIDEFFNKTIHVLPYYEKQGRLETVNGIGNVDDIFKSICVLLDKK